MPKNKFSTLKSILSTASAFAILLGGSDAMPATSVTQGGADASTSVAADWVGNAVPNPGDDLQLGVAHGVLLTSGADTTYGNFDTNNNDGQTITVNDAHTYVLGTIQDTSGNNAKVNVAFANGGTRLTITSTGALLNNVDFAGTNGVLTITNGDIAGSISNATAATLNFNGTGTVYGDTGSNGSPVPLINVGANAGLTLSNSFATTIAFAGSGATVTIDNTNKGDVDFAGNEGTFFLNKSATSGSIDGFGGAASLAFPALVAAASTAASGSADSTTALAAVTASVTGGALNGTDLGNNIINAATTAQALAGSTAASVALAVSNTGVGTITTNSTNSYFNGSVGQNGTLGTVQIPSNVRLAVQGNVKVNNVTFTDNTSSISIVSGHTLNVLGTTTGPGNVIMAGIGSVMTGNLGGTGGDQLTSIQLKSGASINSAFINTDTIISNAGAVILTVSGTSTLTLGGGGLDVNVSTIINNGQTLTLVAGNIAGTVDGGGAGQGSFLVTGNSTSGVIGGSKALAAATVATGATLTTTNITANTITLQGTGNINPDGNGNVSSAGLVFNKLSIGTRTFTAAGNITGIGGAGNNAAISFTDSGALDLATFTLTGSVDFANQNATLTLGTGATVSGAVDSTVGSNGTISVIGNSTVSGIIGGTNAILAINVSGGTLTASAAVTSTNITLTNGGSLTTSSTLNSDAISIETGTLTAGGAIAPVTAFGAAIVFSGNGTLNLGANTLTGRINFRGNNGTVIMSSASNVTGQINFGGDNIGTITLTGGNTGALGSAGNRLGALNLNGTSAITGNIYATNVNIQSGTTSAGFNIGNANNLATVTVSNGAILAPTGNIQVSGDLNLANGSTLTLNGNTITVTGNVVAAGNLTISTVVNGTNAGSVVANTSGDLSASTLTINVNPVALAAGTITVVGGITKDTTNPVTITGATGGYTITYGGNGKLIIAVSVAPPSGPSVPAPSVPAPSVPANVPGVVNQAVVTNFNQSLSDPSSPVSQAVATVTPSAQGVLTELLSEANSGSLSGEAADYLNDVIESIAAGNGYGLQSLQENAPANLASSSAAAAESVQDSISSAISSQLDSMGNDDGGDEGVSSGNEHFKIHSGFWMQGSISKVVQKAYKDSTGYKSTTAGVTIGVDASITEKMGLGFAIIKSDSKTKSKGINTGNYSISKSVLASIYGSYEISPALSFKSTVSFGVTNSFAKSYKTIVKTGKKQPSTSKHGIQQFSADIGLTYKKKLTKEICLKPEAGLKISGSNDSSYRENAPPSLRKTVHKTFGVSYQGNIGLGLSASKKIGQAKFSGSVKASMSQIIGEKNPNLITVLDGQSIPTITSSRPLSLRKYTVGTSLSVSYGMMEYSASYNVGIAKKYSSQSGSLQIRVNL